MRSVRFRASGSARSTILIPRASPAASRRCRESAGAGNSRRTEADQLERRRANQGSRRSGCGAGAPGARPRLPAGGEALDPRALRRNPVRRRPRPRRRLDRFRNDRRLFNLTVSRWPFVELAPIGAPFPERVLSLVVETPDGPLELHNAHIPSARSRGFIKVETCEAIHERLARPSDRHRVLCGDLNLPGPRHRPARWSRSPPTIPNGSSVGTLRSARSSRAGRLGPERRLSRPPRLRAPGRELGASHPVAPQGRVANRPRRSPPRAFGRGGVTTSMAGASRASPTTPASRRSSSRPSRSEANGDPNPTATPSPGGCG